MEAIHTIQTQNGTELKASLIRELAVESGGMDCLLSEYAVENYGNAVFAKPPKTRNGEFRRCRSMMPFDNMDKTLKDFRLDVYGDDSDAVVAEKMARAFVSGYETFRQKGKGYFIYSGTKGSGKTLLSCCLANEITEQRDVSVKFITVLDYLELTKKGYKSMADREDGDRVMKAGILILDDIGVEVGKDWIATTLYQLINYRYSNRLVTIITSNSPLERLGIDDRVKDRINAMCIMLHLPEVSVRSMKAREENERFLKSVMRPE